MLSKSERKILGQLAASILEKDVRKLRNEKLRGEGKRKNTKIINNLKRKIKLYSYSYSDNYKRVLKHRVKNKAQQMIDDLLIILQTHSFLKINIEDFLSNDKHILLRHYLPQSITFRTNGGGVDTDVRSISLKDLSGDYDYKDEELGILKKLNLK